MSDSVTQELADHLPRMYRVALRIVGCEDAARDVTQNACVKAIRAAEQFDGRATLATWLHRITVNCAHDHLRGKKRFDRNHAGWNGDAMLAVALRDIDPAENAEQKDLYRLAIRYVADLPDDCRSTFVLTQLDGYTYDEAAAIENLARGTVASRVFRARQMLLKQMNSHLDGEKP
jgi:RNA polymerase sigma-70 factor, ECF subfamily